MTEGNKGSETVTKPARYQEKKKKKKVGTEIEGGQRAGKQGLRMRVDQEQRLSSELEKRPNNIDRNKGSDRASGRSVVINNVIKSY